MKPTAYKSVIANPTNAAPTVMSQLIGEQEVWTSALEDMHRGLLMQMRMRPRGRHKRSWRRTVRIACRQTWQMVRVKVGQKRENRSTCRWSVAQETRLQRKD